MKIKTSKPNRAGLTVHIDGVSVEFDKDLEAEVTEEEFETISAKDKTIISADEEFDPEVTATEPIQEGQIPTAAQAEKMIADREAAKEAAKEETVEDDSSKEETVEDKSEEDSLEINNLTIPELQEFIKGEYPSKEWRHLNKPELVEYVSGKMK